MKISIIPESLKINNSLVAFSGTLLSKSIYQKNLRVSSIQIGLDGWNALSVFRSTRLDSLSTLSLALHDAEGNKLDTIRISVCTIIHYYHYHKTGVV